MFVQEGKYFSGSAECGGNLLGSRRRARGARHCVWAARTVRIRYFVGRGAPPDRHSLEVVDEVDKRAFLQEKASAATRSSARKSFQDEYWKEAERQHSARLKNTEQTTPKRKKQQCLRAA